MHMKSSTSRAEEPPSVGAAYGPVVGGLDYWYNETVTYGRPGMVSSVTEGWSHDEGRVDEV